jgi:hypothetical protein
MSPQMPILLKSSPDIYHFLAEYCNFQKNTGPKSDSMTVVHLRNIPVAFVVLVSEIGKALQTG